MWQYLDITSCPRCKGDIEVNTKTDAVRCINCNNMRGKYLSNQATYTGYVQWYISSFNK